LVTPQPTLSLAESLLLLLQNVTLLTFHTEHTLFTKKDPPLQSYLFHQRDALYAASPLAVQFQGFPPA